MERWSGKVALVTGASSGIGAKIAEELARRNMKVVAIARRFDKLVELKDKAESLKLSGKIYPIKCDLRKEDEILNVFKYIEREHGVLNVLINNAGVVVQEKIIDGSTDNFRYIMDINVIAVAICTREAVKLIAKAKTQGHIVNINSVAGHDAKVLKIPFSLYPSSKHALTAMCESVRNEIRADGLNIKITDISPGIVKTDMVLNLPFSEEAFKKAAMLTDKEVSDTIIFALSSPVNVEVNELIVTVLKEEIPDQIS